MSKKTLADFTLICPNCGAEATYIEDDTLGMRFLDWTCQKCGVQVVKIESKGDNNE